MDKLIKLIRSEFFKGLEKKTSWGRNHVKELFERSLTNALAKRLTEELPPIEGEALNDPEFEFERAKKEYKSEHTDLDDFFKDQKMDRDWETPQKVFLLKHL